MPHENGPESGNGADHAREADFFVRCKIKDDEMSAYVRVVTDRDTCGVTEDDIVKCLQASGVRDGLKLDRITAIVADMRYNEDVIVASGKMPSKGLDARIVHQVTLYDLASAYRNTQSETPGRRFGTPVSENDVLAVLEPATGGEPGHTVRGRIIDSKPGAGAWLNPGDNVSLSEDGLKLVADCDGIAMLDNGAVTVKEPGFGDWKCRIMLRNNNMEAALVISPGLPPKPEFDESWFRQFLEANGIRFGIRKEAYRLIHDGIGADFEIIVATGEPPLRGRDARVIEHFLRDATPDSLFVRVTRDRLLVEKIPPEKGVRGFNVLDRPLPGPDGFDTPIIVGAKTFLSGDELRLFAAADGYISVVGGAYHVVECEKIDFSISSAPAAACSPGMLIVDGDVPPGRILKAAHHIEINGNISSSEASAGSSMQIHGKVTDCKKTGIRASGVLRVGSASNSLLISGADMIIEDRAENCELVSGGGIHSRVIAGGRVTATGDIEVETLGGRTGNAVTVVAGVDNELRKNRASAVALVSSIAAKITKVKTELAKLEAAARSPEISAKQKQFGAAAVRLGEEHRRAIETAAALTKKIDDVASTIVIRVTGTAFSGTSITIGLKSIRLSSAVENCLFFLDPDGAGVTCKKM